MQGQTAALGGRKRECADDHEMRVKPQSLYSWSVAALICLIAAPHFIDQIQTRAFLNGVNAEQAMAYQPQQQEQTPLPSPRSTAPPRAGKCYAFPLRQTSASDAATFFHEANTPMCIFRPTDEVEKL